MSDLAPCPGCARHVRAHERVCPFCSAALSGVPRTAAARAAQHLSRAAQYALGTALGASLAAASACGGEAGSQVAAYGAPPPDTTGGEVVAPETGDDAGPRSGSADAGVAETDPIPPGTIVALYGAPAPPPPAMDPGAPASAYGAAPPVGPGTGTGPRH